jgi:enoyl-CoA hydratase
MVDSEGGARATYAGSVLWIALNRPDRGNALSAELVEAVIAAVEAGVQNPAIDTIVFQGSGRHFCTGFDLEKIEEMDDARLLLRFTRIEMLLDLVWTAGLRTVAIGSGRIFGAGADLFAACDVRIAHSNCRLSFPGAGFGIVLGTRRLVARVGRGKARHWTSTGVEISSAEALAAGLATEVVDAAEPAADVVGRLPPISVARETLGGLHRASGDRESDRDLAALVRSASRPGLKDRIVEYAARRREARA